MRLAPLSPIALLAALFVTSVVTAQRRDVFMESRSHPAIRYDTDPVSDPVAALNARLLDGSVSLEFDAASGYLRALLRALDIPVESQMLVFSQTSFQAPLINIHNPRAVYFNDTVAVGWVRGGALLEVAAQDPRQGVIFYSLDQKRAGTPRLTRNNECLACHLSWETLGVPGLMVQSVYPLPDEKSYINGFLTVQGSPLERRWGGWWVTGNHGGARHMGNIPVMPKDKGKSQLANPMQPLTSVKGQFDLKGYPTPFSDVVPLLVLAHQTHMTNLMTRMGWESRVTERTPGQASVSRVQDAARELVDYMLFINEAPLVGAVAGTAGYAEKFAAAGPRDGQGRSLRELDLQRRLFRYPCSYMIYSPAFDALSAIAKDAIYARLWEVLSGAETDARYGVLSTQDREAVLAILRATKADLPSYFRAGSAG
jgi:hypothetical protein